MKGTILYVLNATNNVYGKLIVVFFIQEHIKPCVLRIRGFRCGGVRNVPAFLLSGKARTLSLRQILGRRSSCSGIRAGVMGKRLRVPSMASWSCAALSRQAGNGGYRAFLECREGVSALRLAVALVRFDQSGYLSLLGHRYRSRLRFGHFFRPGQYSGPEFFGSGISL